MRRIAVVLGITLAGCAAPPPGELQPMDFAHGVSVDAPAGESFFRLTLPEYVFSETAWPDLRDLRLFNAAGEAVPFARTTPPASRNAGRRVALRSFRLESAKPGAPPQIQVGTRAGELELRVAPSTAPEVGAEYVLARIEQESKDSVLRLHLSWREVARNWQQRVTVSASRDLESWDVVAFRRPVLDLRTDDGQRLTQAEVRLDRVIDPSWRYWRIRFDPGFTPALTSVEAESMATMSAPPGVRRATTAQPQPDGSVVYALPAAQPVEKLRITPRDVNSVLPLQIEGRHGEAGSWQPLGRTVAYRLGNPGSEQLSDPVPLGGQMLSAVRLRAVGTSWGAQVPLVEVERNPLLLVVNARGAGPFLLAWGSRAAADTSVPLNTLVPGRGPDDPIDFAEGRPAGRQVLGGESRLTALAPAERAKRWQTVLVWVALVGGAGGLGVLALRVWKNDVGRRFT